MPGNALENPVAAGGIRRREHASALGSGAQTIGGESCQSTPNEMLQHQGLGIRVSELPLTCRLSLVGYHLGSFTDVTKYTRPGLTMWMISKNIRSISWEILFLDESLKNNIRTRLSGRGALI